MSELKRYQDRAAELSGPGWWNQKREAALKRFLDVGFPTKKVESFKYTPVSHLREDGRGFGAGLKASGDARPLEEALGETWVEQRLDQTAALDVAPFRALNTALADHGAVVRVPAGETREVTLDWSLDEREAHGRVLLVVEKGAKLVVHETYAGAGAGLLNQVSEAFVDEGAELSVRALQTLGSEATLVRRFEATLEAGARFFHDQVDAGGKVVRHDLHTQLNGEGASCVLLGAELVGPGAHTDVHARVDHAAPSCTSEERFNFVMSGDGHGVFNGAAFVHKDAQHTEAEQQNRNLLLSRDAQIDTKPQLEIYADDVQCAHGATVGALDEDALFYLKSRGISSDDAQKMLTRGFVNELVDQFRAANDDVLAMVERAVDALLEAR